MMNTNTEKWNLLFPDLVIICPMLFLVLFIPPFTLIMLPFAWIEAFFQIALYDDLMDLILEDIPFLLYSMLVMAVLVNLGNAVSLSLKKRIGDLQSAFYRIRFMSLQLYPALFWGMILGIFFLLGPSRNEHIFLSILLSLPALNLSGAFYAIPLILHLRKTQKLGLSGTIFGMIFSVVIGLDLLTALFIRKKLKE